MKLILKLSILYFLFPAVLFGQKNVELFKQDTLKLDIAQAEQRFLNKSIRLMAAKFDVDIAKANILQAKQWYNPNLSYSQQLYDPETQNYFDNSRATGQVDVQLNQLVSIAGKHMNTVKLAKIDAEKSQLLFDEVVRSLKFELYTDFSNLLAAQQKTKLIAYEETNLNLLINAEEQELKLGAIAGNEIVRLKAERMNIRNEALSIEGDLLEAQKGLKQLLNYPYTSYLVAVDLKPSIGDIPPFDQVMLAAEKNRPDLLLANTEVKYQSQNLKLQKSTAVPDLTIGLEYDRRSSYVENYYGIGASMDIPFFNRNQGNIKVAKFQLEQAKALDTLQTNEVKNEIANSYVTLYKIKSRLNSIADSKTSSDIEDLVTSAVKNYEKKYIGLLEFLDQLRTYKDAKFGLIDLNSSYFISIQQLNYTVGTTILK